MTINEWLESLKESNTQWESIKKKFRDKSYLKVEPQFFEAYDGKANDYGIKLIDTKGDVISLRQDFTSNIMRDIKSIWQGEILRLQYDGTVFYKNSTGFVEEKQIGVELIGLPAPKGDLEILEIVAELAKAVDGILVISHSDYLKNLLLETTLNEETSRRLLRVIELKKVEDLKAFELPERTYNQCVDLMALKNFNLENLISVEKAEGNIEVLKQLNLYKNISKNEMELDLTLNTKYPYYQGIIFQVFLKDCNQAVITGGRYDTIVNEKTMPAIGFSIDFKAYIGGNQ